MGEFTTSPRETTPHIARNHRRTIHMECDVLSSEVSKLACAVRARENMAGYIVRVAKGVARAHLAYGPVQGAWASDIVKFLGDSDIDYQDLEEVRAEHAEGCRHKKCIAI